jgi:phage tail-like protein
MAGSALRVLLQHHDPTVHRRLRQALLSEPDIELLDAEAEPAPVVSLAERLRLLTPDIVVTDDLGDRHEGERIRDVLIASPVPARVVLVNGHRPPLPSVVPVDGLLSDTASRADIIRLIRRIQSPSTYLSLLPAIFSRDDFVGRFLRIFESVLDPIDRQIGTLESYLDPDLAPDLFLPWLGSWLDTAINDRWPRERQVALIRAAPDLHRWRGTRRGLTEHLRLYLDITPEIEEAAGGLRLGPSTQLGFRTVLGEAGPRHHFTVTLRVPEPRNIDYTAVAALIDAQRPAHCTYTLVILPSSSAPLPTPANGDQPSPTAPEPAPPERTGAPDGPPAEEV